MANESPRSTPADDPRSQPGPPADDPLRELEDRVRAAQDAAERLMRDAAEAAAATVGDDPPGPGPGPGGRRPPPRGYATPGAEEDPGVRSAEVQALAALIDLGRSVVPVELRRQLADLIRELLLLVRAVIDWYLERLELGRRPPTEVEDIPIG